MKQLDLNAVMDREGQRNSRSRPSAGSYAARIGRIRRSFGIPADYGKKRHFPLQPEATRLAVIGSNPDGGDVRLAPAAAKAWKKMQAAAKRDGVALLSLSGFRSVQRQTELLGKKRSEGEKLADILTWLAAPGYSEHHTGRAIDIGSPDESPLVEKFEKTAEFRWLSRRAGEFGFRLSYPKQNPHGIGYEPWHWFYIGR